MTAGATAVTAVPLQWTTVDSPLGKLLLAATPEGLCGLLFDRADEGLTWLTGRLGQWLGLTVVEPWTGASGGGPGRHLAAAREQLQAYFAGRLRVFDVALDLRGTPFQRQVWRALLDIPYGETRSYGEIAAAIGRPGAARAVGMANNRNPVAIIVPCHRVIGSTGDLVGYGGGLALKAALLKLERDGVAIARA